MKRPFWIVLIVAAAMSAGMGVRAHHTQPAPAEQVTAVIVPGVERGCAVVEYEGSPPAVGEAITVRLGQVCGGAIFEGSVSVVTHELSTTRMRHVVRLVP